MISGQPSRLAQARPTEPHDGGTLRARLTKLDLPCMPPLNLRTSPKARPARSEVEHGARHIRVTALVLTDGIALAQAEDSSHVVGVDELLEGDSFRHGGSLHLSADVSYTR